MTKQEMLKEMDEKHWGHDLDENSSYEDVKEEISDDSDMFPNVRDYDAEDEDGI